ncbi:Signal transduction histidine kinase, phosphotransfer (Hpt) domain [Dillenia turbinata]|uniref:Histidine-containing phosphotransfer protein n=1 Tax=Dillenia turbinata TaxID=194707 RepID=A0AAN8W1P5_9MAGN
MAYVGQLQRKFMDYTKSLYREGIVDEQFTQLHKLQDESNPDFVEEVVTLFFNDSERLLNELTNALEQQNVDFKKVDGYVHQFKGSSSSVGAQRVKDLCIAFRTLCELENKEACLRCLQQVKLEYASFQTKLESLFKLEKQIAEAHGTVPTLD